MTDQAEALKLYVVLARAHLWDPYWTRHAAADLGYKLPWPPMYDTLNRYTPRMR